MPISKGPDHDSSRYIAEQHADKARYDADMLAYNEQYGAEQCCVGKMNSRACTSRILNRALLVCFGFGVECFQSRVLLP